MKETILSIAKWHEETFPDATLEGQVKKWNEELKDFRETNYRDAHEFADMFIVACGIARFDINLGLYYFAEIYDWLGSDIPFDVKELIDATNEKMEKNRKRVWVKSGEGHYHHENGIED